VFYLESEIEPLSFSCMDTTVKEKGAVMTTGTLNKHGIGYTISL